LNFLCTKTTITSGVITAESASLRQLEIAGDNWITLAITDAVPGVSAGRLTLGHCTVQTVVNTYTMTIAGGTLTVTTDANGHVSGVGYTP
jgi:hypothetical protein